jgi:hypothetical protein
MTQRCYSQHTSMRTHEVINSAPSRRKVTQVIRFRLQFTFTIYISLLRKFRDMEFSKPVQVSTSTQYYVTKPALLQVVLKL